VLSRAQIIDTIESEEIIDTIEGEEIQAQ